MVCGGAGSIKSAGYNGLALLNVDACIGENLLTLQTESLTNMSRNIGPLFLRYCPLPLLPPSLFLSTPINIVFELV